MVIRNYIANSTHHVNMIHHYMMLSSTGPASSTHRTDRCSHYGWHSGGLKTALAVKKTEKQCCLCCNSGQVAACAPGPAYAKGLCQLITTESSVSPETRSQHAKIYTLLPVPNVMYNKQKAYARAHAQPVRRFLIFQTVEIVFHAHQCRRPSLLKLQNQQDRLKRLVFHLTQQQTMTNASRICAPCTFSESGQKAAA